MDTFRQEQLLTQQLALAIICISKSDNLFLTSMSDLGLVNIEKNGILLPKLFWPTVKKNGLVIENISLTLFLPPKGWISPYKIDYIWD